MMTKCAKMRCNGPGPHYTGDVRPALRGSWCPLRLCGALLVGGAHEKTATLHCCVCRVAVTERMSLTACLPCCQHGSSQSQKQLRSKCTNHDFASQCWHFQAEQDPAQAGNAAILPRHGYTTMPTTCLPL